MHLVVMINRNQTSCWIKPAVPVEVEAPVEDSDVMDADDEDDAPDAVEEAELEDSLEEADPGKDAEEELNDSDDDDDAVVEADAGILDSIEAVEPMNTF